MKTEFIYGKHRKSRHQGPREKFPLNFYNFGQKMKVQIKGENVEGILSLQRFNGERFVQITVPSLMPITGQEIGTPEEVLYIRGPSTIAIKNNRFCENVKGKKAFYRLCLTTSSEGCVYSYFCFLNGGKTNLNSYINDLISYIGCVDNEEEAHIRFQKLCDEDWTNQIPTFDESDLDPCYREVFMDSNLEYCNLDLGFSFDGSDPSLFYLEDTLDFIGQEYDLSFLEEFDSILDSCQYHILDQSSKKRDRTEIGEDFSPQKSKCFKFEEE
jgi:hypothetical protein